jgi:geranylgeranyl diphosphate synthase type II
VSAGTGPGPGPDPRIYEPLRAIEAYLDAHLKTDACDRPESLGAAMRYSTLDGGKRIRPLLAWHSCTACGGSGEDSLPAGCAVEFVHAFSLIHDDLPALDNDDLRRGKPTLHKHAGEAMAVLAGDQLLVEAFVCLTRAGSMNNAQRVALCRELALATSRMVSGQVYDTLGGLPPGMIDIDRLRLIHRNKTGALIAAGCRMGAMCREGGCPTEALEAITRFGQSVGLIFQIVDDLIDVTQSSEHTGKRTGKDLEAGKITYPGVIGIEASQKEVARLSGEAAAALSTLGPAAASLRTLCEHMSERTN